MRCLRDLKEIGYQTGCGFMVGSPGQTVDHLTADLRFIKTFRPHMVGIGPFLSHRDTPFARESNGSTELTLFLLSVIRLLLPRVLLPATTALGTAKKMDGKRESAAAPMLLCPTFPRPLYGKNTSFTTISSAPAKKRLNPSAC